MLELETGIVMPTLETISGKQTHKFLYKIHYFSRCPEYDTFEGNKHTLAGTLHTCDGGNGNWNGCDRSGCQTNIHNLDSNAMCPEDR